MDNKLSELSKPVQIFKHPSGRNFWSVSADSNAGHQGVEPFYSQEYLSAPPAPAVPGELLEAMVEVIRISDRDHEAWNRAKEAIAACRAAMLAQPVSQGCKLVPVNHQNCPFCGRRQP